MTLDALMPVPISNPAAAVPPGGFYIIAADFHLVCCLPTLKLWVNQQDQVGADSGPISSTTPTVFPAPADLNATQPVGDGPNVSFFSRNVAPNFVGGLLLAREVRRISSAMALPLKGIIWLLHGHFQDLIICGKWWHWPLSGSAVLARDTYRWWPIPV